MNATDGLSPALPGSARPSPITKATFITNYVRRARAASFAIAPTEEDCIYAADPIDNTPAWPMIAAPCDCGCQEGWGMSDAAVPPSPP